MASSYKPSAISFNSPRASPFRRPSSPSSPTTVIGRSSPSPNGSPTRAGPSPMTSPSKLKQSFTAAEAEAEAKAGDSRATTRCQTEPPPSLIRSHTEPPRPVSPSRDVQPSMSISSISRNAQAFTSLSRTPSDTLSKLPPALLHSMREAFSVLDHNSTGTINSSSVTECLSSLGLQESNTNTASFFPPGQPQSLSLPQYLNQLADILIGLSPQQELLNALSAFDDDDSGQIDVAELRDALLHTTPEKDVRPLNERDVNQALEGFTGRRVFGKTTVGIAGVRGLSGSNGAGRKQGDVFRYLEFVGNLTGGANGQPTTPAVQGQAVAAT